MALQTALDVADDAGEIEWTYLAMEPHEQQSFFQVQEGRNKGVFLSFVYVVLHFLGNRSNIYILIGLCMKRPTEPAQSQVSFLVTFMCYL